MGQWCSLGRLFIVLCVPSRAPELQPPGASPASPRGWLLPAIFGDCRFIAYHKRSAPHKFAPPLNGLKIFFRYGECTVPTCFSKTGERWVAFRNSCMQYSLACTYFNLISPKKGLFSSYLPFFCMFSFWKLILWKGSLNPVYTHTYVLYTHTHIYYNIY